MLIPALCVSQGHFNNIPSTVAKNFYLGDGVSRADKNVTTESLLKIANTKNNIVMIHMMIPKEAGDYYKVNEPYFDFIQKIGRVGITLHYIDPKTSAERNIMFREFLRIHQALPEAVMYIENCHDDLYDLMDMVQKLRDLDIESYMLIDTCHLEMDCESCITGTSFTWDYNYLFSVFKDYIGAFHISASKSIEGMSHKTHGKPINTDEDEVFYRHICEAIASVDFRSDVYVIPEITEDTYDNTCFRRNGYKALNILKEYVTEQKMRKVI